MSYLRNQINRPLEIIKSIGVLELSNDDGHCSCGKFEICGVKIDYHDCGAECNDCKYSGIHVTQDENCNFDLQQIAEEVYSQITKICNNIDWNISYKKR